MQEYRHLYIRFQEQNMRIEQAREGVARGDDIFIDPVTISASPLVLVGGGDAEAERMTRYFQLTDSKIYVKKK